jgi:hypothetical protein
LRGRHPLGNRVCLAILILLASLGGARLLLDRTSDGGPSLTESGGPTKGGGLALVDCGLRLGNVFLADLDGDGDLDALVADAGKCSRIWLNEAEGVFRDSGWSNPLKRALLEFLDPYPRWTGWDPGA